MSDSTAARSRTSAGSPGEVPSVTVAVGRFDPLVSRGLIDVLRGDDKLALSIREDGSGPERVARLPQGAVVILDEAAERQDAAELRSTRPDVGVVVLAHQPPHSYGMLLLAAGMTCIPWSASAAAILSGVHLSAQGGCLFLAASGEMVERADRRKEPVLTKRETDILERSNIGMSPMEIATELRISVTTVRDYTARLRRKLKVPSTRELAELYIPPVLKLS